MSLCVNLQRAAFIPSASFGDDLPWWALKLPGTPSGSGLGRGHRCGPGRAGETRAPRAARGSGSGRRGGRRAHSPRASRLDEGPAEAVHLAVETAGVAQVVAGARRAARAASGWSRSSRTRGSRAGPPAGLRDERPVRSRPREPHNPHPESPGAGSRSPSPPGLSARRPGPEPALDVTATDLLTDYLSGHFCTPGRAP